MKAEMKMNRNRPGYTLFTLSFTLMLLTMLVSLRNVEAQSASDLYKPAGNEGIIAGTVSFIGTPSQRRRIDMSQDSNCSNINSTSRVEDVVVTNGRLANVMVYIVGNEGLSSHKFETPSSAVVLDQKRCIFVPRILGMQAGQTLRFLNSDPTTHNIHPSPRNNPEWNMVQGLGGKPLEKTFKRPEMFIPVKCNQHPWMIAYVSVFTHPFFAVTGKDGSFKIGGLPPGKYTLAARHEVFGEQTVEVTINPQEAENVSFKFNAKVAYAPVSVKAERAIILQ
jgi:plastocyanin